MSTNRINAKINEQSITSQERKKIEQFTENFLIDLQTQRDIETKKSESDLTKQINNSQEKSSADANTRTIKAHWRTNHGKKVWIEEHQQKIPLKKSISKEPETKNEVMVTRLRPRK